MKNKVLAAVLSVVIAFGLWVYVTNVVSPESEQTYYDIPVILQNENILAERGLMITSELPTITLKLKGNRTDLNNLNEANINILVSMAGIEAPGDHLLRYNVSYPGNIPDNAVQEEERSLDLIPITVENKQKKSVPVYIEYVGSVPDGFIADKENATLSQTAVEITGPESVVTQVHQARILVDLNERSETFAEDYPFTLCNSAGEAVDVEMVTVNTESVNLSVQIQRYMDVELKLTVIDGGGATRKTCDITIDPDIIRVSGNEALLDKLPDIELGTIDLSTVLKDESFTFPIVLPEGVTNETGVTEAKVDVKFPALKTRTISVTNIMPVNVPEGLEAELITKALEVQIRGPIALVDALKETDITASVDFAGAQIGAATMKATIALAPDFADVGALGSYSVSATLQDPAQKDAE